MLQRRRRVPNGDVRQVIATWHDSYVETFRRKPVCNYGRATSDIRRALAVVDTDEMLTLVKRFFANAKGPNGSWYRANARPEVLFSAAVLEKLRAQEDSAGSRDARIRRALGA